MADLVIDDTPKFDWSKDYGEATPEALKDAEDAFSELGLKVEVEKAEAPEGEGHTPTVIER